MPIDSIRQTGTIHVTSSIWVALIIGVSSISVTPSICTIPIGVGIIPDNTRETHIGIWKTSISAGETSIETWETAIWACEAPIGTRQTAIGRGKISVWTCETAVGAREAPIVEE